jgi:hypothetical protein
MVLECRTERRGQVIYLPQGDCPGKKTGSGVFRLSENRELKEIKVKMKNEK